MRALTVRQPWASLIALGYKRMETRSRTTSVRGPIAIHAGLAMPCKIGETLILAPASALNRVELDDFDPLTVERDRGGLLLRGGRLAWPYRLPMGVVVATSNLFQVRPTSSIEHAPGPLEEALGDHSPGRFAWSLETPQPIPTREHRIVRGRQGWWDWTPRNGER